ncbi:MAG: PhaM family polyhydroxyalkanoate granule multifunctional regulatory protein [Burkholderiaceae bacterium]
MKDKLMGMAGLPFAGMATGLDFVKQVWSNVDLPAGAAGPLADSLSKFITPTLDVKEIDKRIADLRAVEKWLDLNLNMLKATVQALEVQRGTITQLSRLGIGKDEHGESGSLKELPKVAMENAGKLMSPSNWWAMMSGPVAEMMGSAAKAGVKRAVKATAPRSAVKKSAKKAPAKRSTRKT